MSKFKSLDIFKESTLKRKNALLPREGIHTYLSSGSGQCMFKSND